jgi:hypothetical protein
MQRVKETGGKGVTAEHAQTQRLLFNGNSYTVDEHRSAHVYS